MAKKQLNVKLLAVVFGLLGIGVAVVGGILLVQFRNDPVKHIRKADALMAEGNVNAALKQYGRGIGKAPYEMAYYDKMLDALVTVVPETDVEKQSRFRTLIELQTSRAQNASDSAERSAADNRAMSAKDAFDTLAFYPWSQTVDPDTDLVDRVKMYDAVSAGLRPLDQVMDRLPPEERDPRLAAMVKARVLEPTWRRSPLDTDSAWRDSLEEIVEASRIDPSYVPIHFGRLHGLLERYDKSVSEGDSARVVRRELEEDGGFDAVLAEVRNTIGEQSAPEIDLLEQDRNWIAFLAGLAGTDEGAVTPVPDPEVVRNLDVEFSGVDATEKAYRLELLRVLLGDMMQDKPTGEVDPNRFRDFQEALGTASRSVIMEIAALNPDDYRGQLLAMSIGLDEIGGLDQEAFLETVRLAEPPTVGVNSLLYDALQNQAIRIAFTRRLAEVIEEVESEGDMADERLAALTSAYEDVQRIHSPDLSGKRTFPELDAALKYYQAVGRVADIRGDEEGKRTAFREAMRALNLLLKADDGDLRRDPYRLAAAIEVAKYMNQAGLALDLFRKFPSSVLGAEDFALRFALITFLFDAGRPMEAEIEARKLADDIAAAEAAGIVIDDVLKTRIEMAVNNTSKLNTGGVIEAFPGAEVLALERRAAYVGDVEERRRLLDQILDQPAEKFNQVILEEAALRRAALEATEGDFDRAKEYATRVLELNPDAQAAKLILRSDESTSLIQRAQIIAELANDNEQDQQVAVIQSLSGVLRNQSSTLDPKDVEAFKAERDRLLTSIEAAPEKRPAAIRMLISNAMNRGDLDLALEYIEALEIAEQGATPLSTVLKAAVFTDQDRVDEAIVLVEDAINTQGFGDDQMLNAYADLLVRKGRLADAMVQYEQAFRLAPNRPRNAINYAKALQREGRNDDVLRILREGKKDGRRSRAYRDIWLNEEIRAGNPAVAITERQRQLRVDPTDFTNAIELGNLLAESRVDREDIRHLVDDQRRGFKAGEEIYSEAQWGRLPLAERGRIQQEYLAKRTLMAKNIFDQLLETDLTNPNIVVGAHRFYLRRGMVARAEEILSDSEASLRRIVEDGGNAAMTENQARDRLARVLAERGRFTYLQDRVVNRERALQYFEEAVDVESPYSGVAEAIIVSFLQTVQELELSAQYQARLLEEFVENERSDRDITNVARRLIELQVASNDVEAASDIADRFIDRDNLTVLDHRALGSVALGTASMMRRDGAAQDAIMAMLDTAKFHYKEASRMSGGDVQAAGMAASVTDARWRWSDESEQDAIFEQLISELQDVVALDEASWPARRALADSFIANRDFERAALELKDFLQINPRNKDARLRLVQCLSELGNNREAIEVSQAGFDLAPTDFDWAETIGQLRANAGQYDEAANQFGDLFQETKDPKYLNGQVRFLLAREPPAADAVIGLARENNQLFTKNPYLMGSYAVALADSGKRSEALQRFESAYRLYKSQPNQLPRLAMWMSRLHPKTFDGAQALQLYADEISGNDPGTIELLELAVKWQQVAENEDTDPEQVEEARSLGIDALRRAADANTDPRGVMMSLIRLGAQLDAQDDCAGAIEAFERGLELQKNNPELLNNLAYLGTQCGGDLYLALNRSEAAVESRPADPTFRDTLGTVLLRIARSETSPDARDERLIAAERELRKSIKLGGKAWSWIHLAELKAFQGDSDEARLALRQASDFELNAEQKKEIDQVLSELGGD